MTAPDLKRIVDEIASQYWSDEITSPDELAYRVTAAVLAIMACWHCADEKDDLARAFAAYSDDIHLVRS